MILYLIGYSYVNIYKASEVPKVAAFEEGG